jgi:hypothetical protein
MIQYNLHFQPADTELVRMEAALHAIVTGATERERTQRETEAE